MSVNELHKFVIGIPDRLSVCWFSWYIYVARRAIVVICG